MKLRTVFALIFFALLLPGSPFAVSMRAQPPAITTPPSPAAGFAGASAVFSVVATGATPLVYQWYRGESGDLTAPVAGATGPLLVTPALTETTRFWVRISNSAGIAESQAATMDIPAATRPLTLRAVGNNSEGQLGDGSYNYRSTPVSVATDVIAVSAGSWHTHFIKGDASLWAMGYRHDGRLGDGYGHPFTGRTLPIQVSSGVASVSAGSDHTLFVKTDASLWATGSNLSRELANGPIGGTLYLPEQTQVGVAAAAAGRWHSLFVKTDGTLWAVGYNAYGQLGDGSQTARVVPVQIASEVISVAAGRHHSLFLKVDGSLWAMGRNTRGELGDGSLLHRSTPVQVASDVVSMTAGEEHTLFVKADGSLWAMGDNHRSQLGDGSKTRRLTPVQITSDVVAAAAGAYHTCFLKTDTTLWTVGDNTAGQLGDGTTTDRATPLQVARGVASVAAGQAHTVFLQSSHAVTFDLGIHGLRNGGGELVQEVLEGAAAIVPTLTVADGWVLNAWDRSFTSITEALTVTAEYVIAMAPELSAGPAPATIPEGASAALAITAVGNGALTPLVYQWYRGEAGDTSSPVPGATGPLLVTPPLQTTTRFWARITNGGVAIDSPAATVTVLPPPGPMALCAAGGNMSDGRGDSTEWRIQVFFDVISASAGMVHSLFIGADASLWSAGRNFTGQLGDGTTADRAIPAQIATDVAFVSAGWHHSLFVKKDGTLWAMGHNEYGQLGDGTTIDRLTPVLVSTEVSAVSAGEYHTLFRKTDGSLWAMGSNYNGRLGDGSLTHRATPVQIAVGVASLSAGGSHSTFVKTDGSLWAVGYNIYGQLGDGSRIGSPTAVLIDTGVVSVSAGLNHTLFVKTDGSLWAMGSSGYGQLGHGGSDWRLTPVQVASDVARVSAGGRHTLFVKTDGSLWGMGQSDSGELGFTAHTVNSPVVIAHGVGAISAGNRHSLFLRSLFTVTFDLGARGSRSGGGELVQRVLDGAAATAPTVTAVDGWALSHWDVSFDTITEDLVVTAQYVVPTPPLISAPPVSVVVAAGTPAFLTVAATGNAPLTPLVYRWYRGESGDLSSPVPGATGPLLVPPGPATTSRFWVRVSNAGAVTDTPAATITVLPQYGPLTLSASGYNAYGQLGDGSNVDRYTATRIAIGVKSASTGRSHMGFIRQDGSLWTTGNNASGQLGDGSFTSRNQPVRVATDVGSVAAGGVHTVFVKTDRSLWAMGGNQSGQLGDGSFMDREVPVQIATDVASVASGESHTLFIKTDGSLWAMGDNAYGQRGDDSTDHRFVPTQVAAGVAAVSAGAYHTVFVKTDGSLWGMGSNDLGQLSDRFPVGGKIPVQLASGVIAASAGWQHTHLIKSDRSLWGFGLSMRGQIGGGPSFTHFTPVPVATGVGLVSAGADHTLFSTLDGSLHATGSGSAGQLGNGTFIDRTVPGVIAHGVPLFYAGPGYSLFLKPLPPSFAAWTAPFILSTRDSAPDADPDADGVANLLEYAFGTSPIVANSSATAPAVARVNSAGQPGLALTHRRNKAAASTLTYVYQSSPDLLVWTPVTVAPVVTQGDVDGDGLVELVTVTVPLPAGADSRLFLRVAVSE